MIGQKQKLLVRLTRVDEMRGEPLPLPQYMTEEAAGFDLMADRAFELLPGARAVIPTGFSMELPKGYEGQVRPRSGLAAKHGVTVLNAPGTIDSDYRGEVGVILVNLSDKLFSAKRGERIAQLIIAPVMQVDLVEVASLGATTRGAGGFGSTG